MASSPELSDRDLERVVLRLVGAVIAVVLAAGVAVAVTREEGSSVDATDALEDTGLNAIGPVARTDLASYIEDRGRALDQITGRRAAVVSFSRYLTVDEVSALVRADRLLVAGRGGDPAVVTAGPLSAWVEEERSFAAEELANLERLLESTDQADFVDTYREDIERYRHLAATLSADAALVYAAAVVATADQLRALAANEAVRLIDIGPEEQLPADEALRGLRPEETGRAGEPPYRPIG